MPVFRLEYTTARTDHAISEYIEWVTDGSWDADRTRNCFHQRYPDAGGSSCTELDPCPYSVC